MIADNDFPRSGPTFLAISTAPVRRTHTASARRWQRRRAIIDVQGRGRMAGCSRMPPRCSSCRLVRSALEQRLPWAQQDSEAAIVRRLQVAREEVASFTGYDYIVLNDKVTAAVDDFEASCWRSAAASTACEAGQSTSSDLRASITGTMRSDASVTEGPSGAPARGLPIDRSKLPNTFEFVVTAGARARQLLAGSACRRRHAQEDDAGGEGSADGCCRSAAALRRLRTSHRDARKQPRPSGDSGAYACRWESHWRDRRL